MRAIVISDVHLGSLYCRLDRFADFLRTLPPDAALVLNGDVADAWRWPFPEPHLAALALLREESRRRDVVWIRGNNDRSFVPPDSGRIRFESGLTLEGGVHVTHGHQFDRVLHHNVILSGPFRVFHKVRMLMGGEPMDVAAYVKSRWGWVYHALRRHIVRQIVAYAREHGHKAMVCGHLHYAEDVVVAGIRYVNTGSWTEPTQYFVTIDGGEPRLQEVQGHAGEQMSIHSVISPAASRSGIGSAGGGSAVLADGGGNDSGRNAHAFRSKDGGSSDAMHSGCRDGLVGRLYESAPMTEERRFTRLRRASARQAEPAYKDSGHIR